MVSFCVYDVLLSHLVYFARLYTLNVFLRGDLEVPGDADVCYPNIDGFVSALLFLVETQRTIGYGARTVSPRCYEGVFFGHGAVYCRIHD